MHDPQTLRRRLPLGELLAYSLLILALLGLAAILNGCMDVAQWQLRTFYGLDCRTEKLVDGKCVPVKQGGSDVHTAQP
jgi:hypothetical protein